jgi:hypothetical protein
MSDFPFVLAYSVPTVTLAPMGAKSWTQSSEKIASSLFWSMSPSTLGPPQTSPSHTRRLTR